MVLLGSGGRPRIDTNMVCIGLVFLKMCLSWSLQHASLPWFFVKCRSMLRREDTRNDLHGHYVRQDMWAESVFFRGGGATRDLQV